MKIIDRRTHGYLDYLAGLLLIAAPFIFNFYEGGIESWIPIILGAGTVIYSLITDYELGVVGMITMKTHLAIDVVSVIFLAASPWLFGFPDLIFWPHLVVGIIEILVPLMTDPNSKHISAAKSTDFVQKK